MKNAKNKRLILLISMTLALLPICSLFAIDKSSDKQISEEPVIQQRSCCAANSGCVFKSGDGDYQLSAIAGQLIVTETSDKNCCLFSGYWTPVNMNEVAVEDNHLSLPDHFSLNQNYPNPFNPTTTIHFALPVRSHVTLTIFNILGKKVRTLVDDTQQAGYHSIQWDSRDEYGNNLSTGFYFYRIVAGSIGESFGSESGLFIQCHKMLLLK